MNVPEDINVSPELRELLRAFRPAFGNQKHIDLVNEADALVKMDRDVKRRRNVVERLQKEIRDLDKTKETRGKAEDGLIFRLRAELSPKTPENAT